MDTNLPEVTLNYPIRDVELAFSSIVAEMNANPIHINKQVWEDEAEAAAAKLECLMADVTKVTKGAITKPNSGAECTAYFKSLGANLWRKTPKGAPTMDKEVLLELAQEFPIADTIVAAREALAVLGQLKAWMPFALAGKAQPEWDQFGTPMGRLSCKTAALQNRVMEVRKTVVPKPGHLFLSVDGKQMEYRVNASLSQNQKLIQAFQDKSRDFHQVMGDKIKPWLKAGKDTRKAGKTLNFALLYRMGDNALAAMLGVDLETAAHIRLFMESEGYSPDYAEGILSHARKTGEISTYFGRTRSMPRLQTAHGNELRELEKTAWHHHNAGTAADLFKMLCVTVDRELIHRGLRPHVTWLINMHDEFILEILPVYSKAVQEAIVAAQSKMVLPSGWLPIELTMTQGSDWAALDS